MVQLTPEQRFEALNARLEPQAVALASHDVFDAVDDLKSLCTFMESHVFAVWDFMSLVKSLQVSLTCVTQPWLPNHDNLLARFINEIVLDEESDQIRAGVYRSHYELYLAAMREIGADTLPIEGLLDRIRGGQAWRAALLGCPVPPSTLAFVRTTLDIAEQPTHVVAAAFVMAREDVIPDMFRRLLKQEVVNPEPTSEPTLLDRLERFPRAATRLRRHLHRFGVKGRTEPPGSNLRIYLQQHIELDSGSHGPMARRLLTSVCGQDETRWEEAERAAQRAIKARHELWDGVLAEIRGGPRVQSRALPQMSTVTELSAVEFGHTVQAPCTPHSSPTSTPLPPTPLSDEKSKAWSESVPTSND